MKVYSTSVPELGTWALKDPENVITLNTAPWAAGIYMTHFIASDGTLSIQKLVIVN